MERIEAVKSTGIADEIIVEEYEGQKIDDIRKYGVDIFTVGSDWEGYFDYLNEYCKVIYLPRTEGVSSSEIREKKRSINLGLVGEASFLNKVWNESNFVNGIHIGALCTKKPEMMQEQAIAEIGIITDDYDSFLSVVDAVYIRSLPKFHYEQIRKALESGKHVLCESPLTLNQSQSEELLKLAEKKNLILMEAIKTAYATAYYRLLLLIKAGKIGDVYSVDAVCTSIRDNNDNAEWNNIHEWGPTALLPVYQILGTHYNRSTIASHFRDEEHDSFTKIDFIYDHAVASIKIGDGVKSEGELVVSGSKGYIYVPAPWWKTDYFEIRFEKTDENKRYFYQLDGEGIRYELVAFTRSIESCRTALDISREVTLCISKTMEQFQEKDEIILI